MPHAGRVVDSLTVLTCAAGCVAGKVVDLTAKKIIAHNCGKLFHAEERRFEGIDGLADLIAEIEQDNRKLVIRAAPVHDFGTDRVRATKYYPEREGTDRTNGNFRPCDRAWVMADLDKLPLPPDADLVRDPENVVRWAISSCLPPEFHDVSCFWQFSTSTHPVLEGFVSIHIWFCLDRPCEWGDLQGRAGPFAPAQRTPARRGGRCPRAVPGKPNERRPDPGTAATEGPFPGLRRRSRECREDNPQERQRLGRQDYLDGRRPRTMRLQATPRRRLCLGRLGYAPG